MDWVNEQTLMMVLIGVVFVIGVHFDLHLRHIGKMLNETNDTLKSVKGLLDDVDGRIIPPKASEYHPD